MISKGIFITRFKQLCRLNNKTQAEIAEILGISVNGLKHYLRKTNNTFPPVEYLDLMAKEFNVDIGYLIGEINEPRYNEQLITDFTGLRTHTLIDNHYNLYFADKTYACDLILKKSHQFSSNFCELIDTMADSTRIKELSDLVDQYIWNRDDKIIVVKEHVENDNGRFEYAYRNNEADKKVLHNRIISLFDEIIENAAGFSPEFDDPDTSHELAIQLIQFIESSFDSIPYQRLIKIVQYKLDEIKHFSGNEYILRWGTPDDIILQIPRIAEKYNYSLSYNFMKSFVKWLNTKN